MVCHQSFTRKKRQIVSFADFIGFHRLIVGIYNREGLTNYYQVSRVTLSCRFKIFFDNPVGPKIVWNIFPPDFPKPWVYGVDGKWLRRQGVFIIHRNITTKENIYWSYAPSESYLALYRDMETITNISGFVFPVGAISDWKGSIVAAVSSYLGPVPHQRCLTHVERTAKNLLPKNSPFLATLILRSIAEQLITVTNEKEKEEWLEKLDHWKNEHGMMLTEKTTSFDTKRRWWYTHGNLRRGYNLLSKGQEPFFVHLINPLIPKSNNSVEGVISQASGKLSDHRGMKTEQQVSFLSWYMAFSRIKTKQDLRKLWGAWRKMKK